MIVFHSPRTVDPAEYYTRRGVRRGHPHYVISRSDLKVIRDAPALWLRDGEKDTDDDSTLETNTGNLVDELVTEGRLSGRWAVRPAVYPERNVRQKKGKKIQVPTGKMLEWSGRASWCKQWLRHQGRKGKTVVTGKTLSDAHDMAEALEARALSDRDYTVGELIAASDTQVGLGALWLDPITGLQIPVQGLMDCVYWDEDTQTVWIFDVKTSVDTHTWKYKGHGRKFAYDMQSVIYEALLRCAYPDWRVLWGGWLVVRNHKPYLTATFGRKLETEEEGVSKTIEALTTYAECLSRGHFPDHTPNEFLPV
jgi:hypothetical protein